MSDKHKIQMALVCTAFSPLFVRTNSEYTIGRDKTNSIPLDDDLVSRFHAMVTIDAEGNAFVSDRGSRNGTFLNNQRIQIQTPLRNKDKITIGSFYILYKDFETLQEDEFSNKLGSTTIGLNDLGTPDGMVGNLSQIDITELILTMDCHVKTGILTVRSNQDTAVLYFKKGNIIHARFNDLRNIPAINALLAFKDGFFDFVGREISDIPVEIESTTQQILLEYARNLNNYA